MKNSKPLDYLKQFSQDEFKKFGHFLNSDFFGKNNKLHQLYTILKGYHPDYSSRKLTEEFIYKKLCPDKKFNAKYIANLKSKFIAAIRTFISYNYYLGNEIEQEFDLLRFYKEKNMDKSFNKQISKIEELLTKNKLRDCQYSEYMSRLYHSAFFHKNESSYEKENSTFLSAMLHSDRAFVLKKLRYSIDIIVRRNIFKDSPEVISFLQKIKENIRLGLYKEDPLILCYYSLINLLNKFDDSIYQTTRKSILKSLPLVQSEEKAFLLVSLLNAIIRLHTNSYKGNIDLSNEIFELYFIGITENILIQDNILPADHFNNIINLACRLKKFDWLENVLIKDYHKLVKEESQTNVKYLAFAQIDFQKQNYQQSLNLIEKISNENIGYSLRKRTLEIRSYYHLKDFKQAESKNRALYQFINRLKREEKIAQNLFERYNNFRIMVDEILKARVWKDPEFSNELIDKLKSINPIILRPWLKQRILETIKPVLID